MAGLIQKLRGSPFVARVVPFIIFAGLTALQGQFGEASRFWVYFAKTLVGAWLLWAIWPAVKELRWSFSLEAVVIGILVCVMWVGIDPYYPDLPFAKRTAPGEGWNPHEQFGAGTAVAWFLIIARILGSTLVVPPLEEMFYRSFVYRYVIKADFESVPLNRFHLGSFLITSTVFGIVHAQWLAGILCGFAYQWLAIRRGHLGDAITAHAITNFLLGLWVVYKGAWQFW